MRVIRKIGSPYQAVTLLRPSTTASTGDMTALSRFRPIAPSLVTLGTAVDFGELLTVVLSFSPTTRLALGVAGWTLPLCLRVVVDIDVLGIHTTNDLIPIDCLDMTEVVIVEHAHIPSQNVCREGENLLVIINNVTNQGSLPPDLRNIPINPG
jgi:hypothetical protein